MAARSALDLFLDGCAQVRATRSGTAETSYYPALNTALNAVGAGLKPKVFALHHVTGRKQAGIPDFGLFEAPTTRRAPPPRWDAGVPADRGVVEVKGVAESMAALLASEQVARYRDSYGLVLATNLRQFRLLAAGGGGVLESFDLAPDEPGFHALLHGSRSDTLRTRFNDFLQRCMLTRAPLARPEDVAFFLASYARDALASLAEHASLPALRSLRENLERGLGLAFDQREGERLFRSTLVQTLFYGLFSAWVAHAQERPGEAFSWRQADWSLHVPVMQLLFQQVASPQALQPLGLAPLLDAAQAALARVDRAAFFRAFEDASAVRHFYEPFLAFFDPDLRKQLGVWYTPPEIVEYMVERVDRVLREELGVADGLADESVWVLDPCCGTGSYLVAVLDRIRRTLAARGMGDLLAEAMRRAATTRVVGFEIMPAPFVIAHWQVGEALRGVQAHLRDGERAAVYLTNALTGWDADEKMGSLEGAYAALEAERAEARTVKQRRPILVVLGNPPYNAYAGTSPESEGGLVEPYKKGLNTKWGVRKFNLDDLYVRFFRIAERRIAEVTGRGVICFISNFSWLTGASYVVMRQRMLAEFDAIWIDNLNGDSRETGKLTPEGRPDPSVFSTEYNREGIRVGTAIATLVKRGAA
ncbi:MAG: N-6 DNA methylase [Acetobacteraceae bacterium]|nr:N-6 DNA methylase [Acetobacteraceae bacterium]